MRLNLAAYRLLAPGLYALAALYLLKRSVAQPAYLKGWSQRYALGKFPVPQVRGPVFWLHAVSVGETRAARPVVEALLKRYPDCGIVLTHMTPTGKEAGAGIVALAPQRITQCFLPYDTAGNARRFFRSVKPALGLVMETEVWPNLLDEARKAHCPVVLINGRLSEKSLNMCLKWRPLMNEAFGRFAAICAQSEEDAARYMMLQDKVPVVTGSLKFDVAVDGKARDRALEDKKGFARRIVLFASSRQGEEKDFIACAKALARRDVLYVIVVRHPQRFDEVAELLDGANVGFARKSQRPFDEIDDAVAFYLGDTMGEMGYYCALADVVVMGGSFGNFGCQNVIEPAQMGRGVIVGPSTFNFAHVVRAGVASGAVRQVADMRQALDAALEVVSDGEELARFGAKASAFARSLSGATRKTLEVIGRFIKQ